MRVSRERASGAALAKHGRTMTPSSRFFHSTLRASALASIAALSAACSASPDESSRHSESAASSVTIPLLPWAGGTGALTPWGGTDPNRWRPEAILANATSEALNAAWAQPNVREAIVAVPVTMIPSDFFEFGDGQSNAAPSFEWWASKRPPVVATLVRSTGAPTKITLRFDRDLPYGGARFIVRFTSNGAPKEIALDAIVDGAGHKVATWAPPPELGLDSGISRATMLVHPEGWGDWFPLWFRFPARPIAEFKATVPQTMRTFADQGDIQDHERVSSSANGGSTASVRARLQSHAFGSTRYAFFNPQDIHAVFPLHFQNFVTGIGQGWTWVADQSKTPFKTMYTCFEQRRPADEASAPDGGVPSGGGWHKITDPAETVLNDLEPGPIVLGSAMSNPIAASSLPSGGFAYNLHDVATVRFVMPGEAFITPAGGTFTDANGRAWDQANYHWYFFQQAQDVCTEEWVHPSRPNDAFDFGSSTVGVTFSVDGATTSWGQDVYVVGAPAELGAWNARRAVKLAPSAYPTWRGTIALPASTSVAFKFVMMDGGGNVTWESGGEEITGLSLDRVYATPSSGTGVVSVAWRN